MRVLIGFILLGGVLQSALGAHKAFLRKPLVEVAEISKLFSPDAKTPAPKTVEEFLALLPADYRSYFTLMYETQSLHMATSDYPRIIFFGPDARLLTSVSTYPTDPRRNTVELIEFDPAKSAFNFHEISFEKTGPLFVASPSRCNTCHAPDGKPNWEPYDAWPGAFGSVHDKLAAGTHENTLFQDFLKTYRKEPRFDSLPAKFSVAQEDPRGGTTYYTVSQGVGVNSVFSLLTGFLNRERIARLIRESAEHAKYKYAITAALIGCPGKPEEYLSDETLINHPQGYDVLLKKTRATLVRDHKRRIARTAKLQKAVLTEEFNANIDPYGLRLDEVERIAKLRFILENRSVGAEPMDRWSTSLARDSYNFNDGVSGLENLIGHYAPTVFGTEPDLLAKIEYRTLPYGVTSYGKGRGAFEMEVFAPAAPSADLCRDLASRQRVSK